MFKMFSNCIPIKGYTRALIYDTQRLDYCLIPNLNYIILIKNTFQRKELNEDMFDFLLSNEYIFEIKKNEINYFTEFNLEWQNSSWITNLITHENNLENSMLLDIVEKLNVKAIGLNLNQLSPILLNKINKINTNLRLKTACTNFIIKTESLSLKTLKVKLPNLKVIKRNKPLNCIIHKPSVQLFTESQAHHTYFNRKLYIGPKGEIKNAPECEETFGNINEIKNTDELKHIIATPEFQKYWYIHKELSDVCKDCEFRHMCVDSRLPSKREDKSWYHKTECNYNPYICKWEGEEGYRTLEECGVISNEKGFSIDHEKIAAINNILWEEEAKSVK